MYSLCRQQRLAVLGASNVRAPPLPPLDVSVCRKFVPADVSSPFCRHGRLAADCLSCCQPAQRKAKLYVSPRSAWEV